MKKRFPLVLSLLCLAPAMMLGQVAITGAIRGVVTDTSGAVLPNVSIVAEGPALMTPRKAMTDVAGSYLFDSLPPGTYQLTYGISGFRKEVRSAIVITPGFTATISPQLSVGMSQQSVVVQAESVVVDTTNNTSSTTFDEALLQNVPGGRDTFSTVAQAPGVASSDFDIAGSQSFQQSVMQVHGSLPGDQVYIALAFRGAQLADLQTFHPRFAIRQLRFSLAFGPMRKNRPVVFRPEASAQIRRGFSALAHIERSCNHEDKTNHNHADNERRTCQFGIHFTPPGH